MRRLPWCGAILVLAGCSRTISGSVDANGGQLDVGGIAGTAKTIQTAGQLAGQVATSERRGGQYLNPLTGRPFDQGPDPKARAEATAVDEAQRLVDDGLFDRAGTQVDALIAAGSTHPSVPFLKARLLVQAGRLDEAIPWCERAVAASPTWIEPRLLLARVYLKLERPGAAGSVYEDIDRLAPWSPWGPYGTGWVAWMRGDRTTAASRFDEALKRDPDHLPSLRIRAAVAKADGDHAAEERCLSRALVLVPEDPSLHLRLADLAQGQQRLEDSRRHLERAWDLDPRPALAHRLAELARMRGASDDAARWSARAGGSAEPGESLTTPEVR